MCEIGNLSHQITNLMCVSESLMHQICKATHAFCLQFSVNDDFIRKNRDELRKICFPVYQIPMKYEAN
jgi:hypothetical protein